MIAAQFDKKAIVSPKADSGVRHKLMLSFPSLRSNKRGFNIAQDGLIDIQSSNLLFNVSSGQGDPNTAFTR